MAASNIYPIFSNDETIRGEFKTSGELLSSLGVNKDNYWHIMRLAFYNSYLPMHKSVTVIEPLRGMSYKELQEVDRATYALLNNLLSDSFVDFVFNKCLDLQEHNLSTLVNRIATHFIAKGENAYNEMIESLKAGAFTLSQSMVTTESVFIETNTNDKVVHPFLSMGFDAYIYNITHGDDLNDKFRRKSKDAFYSGLYNGVLAERYDYSYSIDKSIYGFNGDIWSRVDKYHDHGGECKAEIVEHKINAKDLQKFYGLIEPTVNTPTGCIDIGSFIISDDKFNSPVTVQSLIREVLAAGNATCDTTGMCFSGCVFELLDGVIIDLLFLPMPYEIIESLYPEALYAQSTSKIQQPLPTLNVVQFDANR